MKILIHYSEIALKGQNRKYFEKKLVSNIREVLPKDSKVQRIDNRILVTAKGGEKFLSMKVKKIFGIANFSFVQESSRDFESVKRRSVKMMKNVNGSFKVFVNRSDKSYPITSVEMAKEIGAEIVRKNKLRVDIKNPENILYIEVFGGKIYLYREKIKCYGGLPVGSSGRVISLLSGGIDSPVSSFLAMKRGMKPIFVHFHAFRTNEEAEKSKIRDIINVLLPYSARFKIYYIPYDMFQLSSSMPPEYELVIFRRFMNRVAEKIAEKENAKALVTGESVGQVASQKLENMAATEAVTSLPIIRPLATFNKDEIISLAEEIGTYNLSIKNYKDCCSIISKHPKTQPNIKKIEHFEKGIDMEKLVNDTLKHSKMVVCKLE